jgi:diaminopimelate epimerase
MSDRVRFTKMSGAGNDFVVLEARAWETLPGDGAAWVRAVCRRGLSVGADGVLVVSADGPGRVRVAFFNPDGGEAFCGNGSRCAARYAANRDVAQRTAMVLLTSVGEVDAVVDGAVVSLTLPPPQDLGEIVLEEDSATFRGRWVVAGVPHVVLPVEGLAAWPLNRIGPALRRHPTLGPSGANVNLVEADASGRVHVRTWERGVESETLSCGTGAVAVALAARLAGAPETVVVVPRGGSKLTVMLPGDPARPVHARLTGDARFIFEGSLDPEATVGTA